MNANEIQASGAEIKNLTVLFSKIWTLYPLSGIYKPEEVVLNLGEYFSEMTNVIQNYGGQLDIFRGDEIMAVFGVPTRIPDHAERACLTALKMVRSFNRLRERWTKVTKRYLNIEIGINTGDMIVGDLGTNQIFAYTVIGDHANLGVALSGNNKIFPTVNHIIISEYTQNELSDKLVTRELDTVNIYAFGKPVAIFELVGEKNDMAYSEEFLAHYNEGLVRYRKREWDEAIGEFKKALVLYEDVMSKRYIATCKEYIKNPPPSDWDGVYTSKIK